MEPPRYASSLTAEQIGYIRTSTESLAKIAKTVNKSREWVRQVRNGREVRPVS